MRCWTLNDEEAKLWDFSDEWTVVFPEGCSLSAFCLSFLNNLTPADPWPVSDLIHAPLWTAVHDAVKHKNKIKLQGTSRFTIVGDWPYQEQLDFASMGHKVCNCVDFVTDLFRNSRVLGKSSSQCHHRLTTPIQWGKLEQTSIGPGDNILALFRTSYRLLTSTLFLWECMGYVSSSPFVWWRILVKKS